ncbi:MAG: tRNA (N(6)-L-threonylcarbamoyladenosine(37)-C(2))-methylthiotransferase MtaB [Chloroflexi bacterium]|nr:MAG: tRNA (N(6)-L-threonylcarbamoyladenosine(37)-C(2))-methylthiotransferase MtaB [Chloroflexota bacterium]
MKVYLQTLGCKLNESELEAWARAFVARGDELVDDPRLAETIVLNTCTVTAQAARKSRNVTRQLARAGDQAQIILTGCYATMSPAQARALPNVTLVVPNASKDALVELARERVGDFPYATPFAAHDANKLGGLRTRAFVKIQDGCNMACTYCIIPLARGRARSRPQAEIVDEIKRLANAGYQEVILTGVQISDYRLEERENGKGRLRGLCDLTRAILRETDLPRLRLTSIAPWDLDAELLDLFSDARLCRHLHLSLQSGSGSVVEFQDSLDFVERMNFARVHVFPYSAREGTVAAQLPLSVDDATKAARHQAMQRVADASLRRFTENFVGRTLNVLYEENTAGGAEWTGYSDNYIRVVTPSRENLSNRLAPTRLTDITADGARGELV